MQRLFELLGFLISLIVLVVSLSGLYQCFRDSDIGIEMLTSCEDLAEEIIAESEARLGWDNILIINDIKRGLRFTFHS